MVTARAAYAFALAAFFLVGGCATRPVNPPIEKFVPGDGYQLQRSGQPPGERQGLVILAFSGGGTRAAAFSYGVLEALRSIEVQARDGRTVRLLDEVDVVTGVSGGSFTALAYGLYGEALFDQYEQRFLKRNVQGDLIARFLNPAHWGALWSTGWGRSELAADYYDEILFGGATFADLARKPGPLVAVSATEIASGSRLVFSRMNFDVLCAQLGPFRLSRAAAASSAVPVVLSPVTIDNYGGRCGYEPPAWTRRFAEAAVPPRPASRTLARIGELIEMANSATQPYLHLVDGGVSDNLGLRAVVDTVSTYEALHLAGQPTPLDDVRRIVVVVVNSVSESPTDWNRRERPPGTIPLLVRAAGVPIDRYSSESVELLKDIAARWRGQRAVRDAAARVGDAGVTALVGRAPNPDLYAIDVSFAALADKDERDYLNALPTSLALPPEAVDRLRAAARKILLASPDLQQVLRDAGARIVEPTPGAAPGPVK